MEKDSKFAGTVMLIDAAFLNFVIADLKKNFERMLGRSLQEVDLSNLITYLALDAGVGEGDNEIQVLCIYDDDSKILEHCQPKDMEKELNNVAFKNPFGEFLFYTFQPEQMTTLEELYLESLKVVADSKEVNRLIVVSFNEEYGDKVTEILSRTDGKEIIQFRMNEPDVASYQWEMLAYPIMQALGVRGDELQ